MGLAEKEGWRGLGAVTRFQIERGRGEGCEHGENVVDAFATGLLHEQGPGHD